MRVLLLAVVTAAAGCAERSFDGPARHVVFVSLDTARADHFGFYGNETVRTPNLDALAAESIVLDDFMTVANTTLASHTSLFTGNYAHTHGVARNGFRVADENVLLTEVLRDGGFVTAGFIGSFPLVRRFRFAQGFDHWDERFEVPAGGEYASAERTAQAVTDAVVEWLDRQGVPENLFLFAHYFDPHAPYLAPAPFDAMYDSRGREGLPSYHELRKRCSRSDSPEPIERMTRQYAGEISYLDHHLGRLFDALRRRGILDEALVVVTSDHGESFNEHPPWSFCFDHGWMNYQETIRSVGMLRLPGAERGGLRIADVVASVDLMPTVLDFLGIPAPMNVDGQVIDLSGQAQATNGPRFCQGTKPGLHFETDPRWKNLLKAGSIRDGRYKFVNLPYANYQEMYDLELDPREETNLLLRPDPSISKLATRLNEQLQAWVASADPLPSCFVCGDREVTEKLKALGYLDVEAPLSDCCED